MESRRLGSLVKSLPSLPVRGGGVAWRRQAAVRNSVQVWVREEVAETHRLCGKIPPSLPDPVYFRWRGVGGGAGGGRIEGQGWVAAPAMVKFLPSPDDLGQ